MLAHSAPSAGTAAQRILVLQGGGALGAYQGGVFEALNANGGAPTWVAGISIGAINAALIAGNQPAHRLSRLREFWHTVSAALQPQPLLASAGASARQAMNEASAASVVLFGVPGFFTPRFPPAALQVPGTPGAISYYDTSPLQQTLTRLIDFKRLNSGDIRVSVGAVNIRSGNFEYFDSAQQTLDVRHIMASGALPPGFAPVEIDGEHYWDGGLVSNTPLQYVLDQPGTGQRTIFQVDLFAAQGELPRTMAEAIEREKEIRFSSRTRLNTRTELDLQAISQAAKRLLAKLPASLRRDPDAVALSNVRAECNVDVVHLIYRSKAYEGQSKDYEFSRLTMQEHWASGHADALHSVQDPRWLAHAAAPAHNPGVHVFDLTQRSAKLPAQRRRHRATDAP